MDPQCAIPIASIPHVAGAETTHTTRPSTRHGRCDGGGAYAEAHETQNRLVWVRCVFAWLSVLVCLAVLSVGYAHGKDRRSLRNRIVVGLFLANAFFSLGLMVPTRAYVCEENGAWVESALDTARNHAGLIGFVYAGKYWTVTYEVFIVLASVASLRSGSVNISRRAEIAGHTVCFLTFVITYGIFFGTALPILTYVYTNPKWDSAQTDAFKEYQALQRGLLDGWIVFFVIFERHRLVGRRWSFGQRHRRTRTSTVSSTRSSTETSSSLQY